MKTNNFEISRVLIILHTNVQYLFVMGCVRGRARCLPERQTAADSHRQGERGRQPRRPRNGSVKASSRCRGPPPPLLAQCHGFTAAVLLFFFPGGNAATRSSGRKLARGRPREARALARRGVSVRRPVCGFLFLLLLLLLRMCELIIIGVNLYLYDKQNEF